MGEFANYKGERIKIGTCDNMYYLRWDQRHLVTESDVNFKDPATLAEIRFRFPFPWEDGIEPGEFEDHDKGFRLDGFVQPELDHGSNQFIANYPKNGYLVSLPCPEVNPTITVGGKEIPIHKNGYGGPASLIQQAWRSGRLVGIVRCNGCGHVYRLEDGYEEAAAVSIRAAADDIIRRGRPDCTEDDRQAAQRVHEIANRLLAGYKVKTLA